MTAALKDRLRERINGMQHDANRYLLYASTARRKGCAASASFATARADKLTRDRAHLLDVLSVA